MGCILCQKIDIYLDFDFGQLCNCWKRWLQFGFYFDTTTSLQHILFIDIFTDLCGGEISVFVNNILSNPGYLIVTEHLSTLDIVQIDVSLYFGNITHNLVCCKY